MHPLSSQDIESELSYAYLHAVASHAGISCKIGNRHEDANGIDATLTAWPHSMGDDSFSEVTLNVQLKATIQEPREDAENFFYRLSGLKRYDDLRLKTQSVPRILVVLFLPREEMEWLHHTPDQLVLQKCAYWQSLRGAPAITTQSVDVKLPKNQIFSPTGLKCLIERFSRRDFPPDYII